MPSRHTTALHLWLGGIFLSCHWRQLLSHFRLWRHHPLIDFLYLAGPEFWISSHTHLVASETMNREMLLGGYSKRSLHLHWRPRSAKHACGSYKVGVEDNRTSTLDISQMANPMYQQLHSGINEVNHTKPISLSLCLIPWWVLTI